MCDLVMSIIKITCVLVRNTISGATPNLLDQNLHFNKAPSLPTCIIKSQKPKLLTGLAGITEAKSQGNTWAKSLQESMFKGNSAEEATVCGKTEQHREKAPNRGTTWKVGLTRYQHNY